MKTYFISITLAILTTGCANSGPLIGARFGEPFKHSPNILHKAVDYYDRYGAPILAVADGVVVIVDEKGSFVRHGRENGTTVVVEHSGGRFSSYGHLSKISVKKGQNVVRGQKIGENGRTGTRGPGSNLPPSDPHVHLEFTIGSNFIDPEKLMVGCFEDGKTYNAESLTYPVKCTNAKK